MKALDLFAGTGWGVACQRLGIEEYGVEIMPAAIATREANGMTTIYRDVWEGLTDPGIVPDHDILIASPPCQTFSMAGSGSGRRALDDVLALIESRVHEHPDQLQALTELNGFDDRTALVLAPLAYAMQWQPPHIAWEQVPTVLPVWEACADVLRAAGYSVQTGIVNAEQHGVPQTRKRAYLVARNDGHEAALPTPTHSRYHSRQPAKLDEGVQKWVSMAEALGWDNDAIVMRSNYGTGGDARNRGMRAITEPAPTVTSKIDRNRWLVDRLPNGGDGTWAWNRPSPTVVGSFRPDIIAAPGYRKPGDPPRQKTPGSIAVTIDEASVLQSYPRDFAWEGKPGKQFLQVGNAVPPLAAAAVLEAVTSGASQPIHALAGWSDVAA